MAKTRHVTPHPKGGWQVKVGGSSRASLRTSTQRDAIAKATPTARRNGEELFIHGRNGQIREKSSYGNDKYPPKG